ncbi:MAG: hypothetical protein GY750_20410 [Lentisphaerae bacterium]|nr:hypothetical protein [Lentisphaerota bacterium]MCP4103758.1 hypothetical protein [Lentisphaerota bacterium]
MFKYIKISLFFAFLSIVTTGCFFTKYHQTAYYDLEVVPVKLNTASEVRVSEFENESGTGSRIRIRTGKYRIVDAGYSKWVQSPGELLGRCLRKSFAGNFKNDAPDCFVSGTLTEFEVELDKMQFVMSGFYNVRYEKKQLNRKFNIAVPIKEKTPVEYARAASQAVNELGRKIAVEINQILKK